MKISIGNFALAPGGDSSPEGLKLNGQYVVQTSGFLRADVVTRTPRGNQANTLTFSCTRDHGTYAAASAFLFSHAVAMPTGGTLTVTTEAFESAVATFEAQASAVQGREGSQLGVTTTHQYTILCGALSVG